jgi:hypothetical protein
MGALPVLPLSDHYGRISLLGGLLGRMVMENDFGNI